MSDPTEEILRRTFAALPRPQCSVRLAADVSRMVTTRQPPDPQRGRVGPRVVIAGYWLLAALASASICRGLSWPGWSTTALWALACLIVPLAYAATLWPRHAVSWTRVFLAPLIGALPAERRS
jgi:hypothetical protein